MIWISGCSGMLGRHISEKISAAGIPHISTDTDVDITDLYSVSEFVRRNSPTWIINCSAYTAVDMAEDEKDKAFALNSIGVKNIAASAKTVGAKVIHFSTDYVFPGVKESGYDENDSTGPTSVYGASKLAGEYELISHYEKYFIFRISWLYGPHGKNFVHTMLNLFSQRDVLDVVNDQFGSPTYTGELADFITGLVQNDSDRYGIYHFSGEGVTEWHDFATEIYKLASKYGLIKKRIIINPVNSSQYPQKAKRPSYSYMLKDKLFNTFGFRPKDWRESLGEFFMQIRR